MDHDTRVSAYRLADDIKRHAHLARDAGGDLYIYRAGVYEPGGERYVKAEVKALLGKWRKRCQWSSNLAKEVCEYLRVDAPELWDVPPSEVINVQNGLLNVETRELMPHSPDFLSAVQLPVEYDPTAVCRDWPWFIASTFPDDAIEVAYEIPAWATTSWSPTGLPPPGSSASGKAQRSRADSSVGAVDQVQGEEEVMRLKAGSIYQRSKKLPDGTVTTLSPWWIKYAKDGRVFRESSGSEDRQDAIRLLKRRQGEIVMGKFTGLTPERIRMAQLP